MLNSKIESRKKALSQCEKSNGRGPACAPSRKTIVSLPKSTTDQAPTVNSNQEQQGQPTQESMAIEEQQALGQSRDRAQDWRNEAINRSWEEWLHSNNAIPPETTDYARYMTALSNSGLNINQLAPRPGEDPYSQDYRDLQQRRIREAEEYRNMNAPLPLYTEHDELPPSYDSLFPPPYTEQAPNSTPAPRRNINARLRALGE